MACDQTGNYPFCCQIQEDNTFYYLLLQQANNRITNKNILI